jgi:hypothetical protein
MTDNQRKEDVTYGAASQVIKALFDSDRRIRYGAVIGEKGEEIVGGMRPGIKSLESERESSRLRIQTLIGMAINRNWNELLGDADYIIVHRSKIVVFIFPLSGMKSLLVSAEPDYPLKRLGEISDAAQAIPKELR